LYTVFSALILPNILKRKPESLPGSSWKLEWGWNKADTE
jgi:hypothetical protein